MIHGNHHAHLLSRRLVLIGFGIAIGIAACLLAALLLGMGVLSSSVNLASRHLHRWVLERIKPAGKSDLDALPQHPQDPGP